MPIDKAIDFEQEGDLAAASEEYYVSGNKKIIESYMNNSRKLREGITELLCGLSCSSRNGDLERVSLYKTLIEECVENQRNIDNICEFGMFREWLGDAHLLASDENCIEYYNEADFYYSRAKFDDMMHWGATPEFDLSVWAIKSYSDHHNEIIQPDTTNFNRRIEQKLNLFRNI